jgi:hypothetical protein
MSNGNIGGNWRKKEMKLWKEEIRIEEERRKINLKKSPGAPSGEALACGNADSI